MRCKSATQKRSVSRPPHHVAFSLPFLPPQHSFPSSPPCCSWVLHVFYGACGLPSVGGRCLVTTAPDPVARPSPAAVRMVEEHCRGISCSFVFSPRGSRAIPPLFACRVLPCFIFKPSHLRIMHVSPSLLSSFLSIIIGRVILLCLPRSFPFLA